MISVPGTTIRYRTGHDGGEVSTDGGESWSFTFRTPEEFCLMHPGATPEAPEHDDDRERELFGETLDDPIPDDLWEMIRG